MSSWVTRQMREVMAGGPAAGDDFFRIKVTGAVGSKWCNVTPAQLQAVLLALTEPGDAPPCEHPLTGFYVMEDGYSRTWNTRIDVDEKVIHAFFNGTEDWSDDGSGEYLVCGECAQMRPIPDDYEIDWS